MTRSRQSDSPDRIDILIDQVGYLTEVITVGFQDFRAELAELKEITRQQAETARQQAETAKQQAESVARLIGIMETLLQNNRGTFPSG
ncbi:MAG: hypothetical protein K6T90_03755 [Leptolyngbyaceae cyanobacterium HOT.MB2.61]|nr:hypothetical protein [Leptolyngbyaceae cyanobacterium HOT.MB2.61]